MNDIGSLSDLHPDHGRPFATECLGIVRRSLEHRPTLLQLRDALGSTARLSRGHADEDLALAIETGSIVFATINHGALHCDAASFGTGEFDRVVWVLNLERDPETEEISAFLIIDPLAIAPRTAPAERFLAAWLGSGGAYIEVLEC